MTKTLKDALGGDAPVVVVNPDHPSPGLVQFLGGLGVDAVFIDCEQGGAGMETVENMARAVRYCFPRDHADKVLVVQIETRAALEGLADFLAVDGIDVLFVGPVDLAKSLGFAGDFRRPEVQAAIDEAIGQIVGAGRVAGMLVGPDDAGAYVAKGVRFLYTHANAFLAAGARGFAEAIERHG